MLPTGIRSVERIRGRWIRDYLGPAAGLVAIASASARHLRESGDIMLRVQEASHELDSLPDQIKSMIEARPANEAAHPDRKVHFFIEFTSRGISGFHTFRKDLLNSGRRPGSTSTMKAAIRSTLSSSLGVSTISGFSDMKFLRTLTSTWSWLS